MRIYSGTTKSLIEDSTYNRVATKLKMPSSLNFGTQPAVAEVNSWNNSLPPSHKFFRTAACSIMRFAGVQLPLTSNAADCLVTGYDSKKRLTQS